jgi:hypothetical protein
MRAHGFTTTPYEIKFVKRKVKGESLEGVACAVICNIACHNAGPMCTATSYMDVLTETCAPPPEQRAEPAPRPDLIRRKCDDFRGEGAIGST